MSEIPPVEVVATSRVPLTAATLKAYVALASKLYLEAHEDVLAAFLSLLAEVWRLRAKRRYLAQRVTDLQARIVDLEMPRLGLERPAPVSKGWLTADEWRSLAEKADEEAKQLAQRLGDAEGELDVLREDRALLVETLDQVIGEPPEDPERRYSIAFCMRVRDAAWHGGSLADIKDELASKRAADTSAKPTEVRDA